MKHGNGDGDGGWRGGDQVAVDFWYCPEPCLVGHSVAFVLTNRAGPRRSAVPSGCGSKRYLQVEFLEPAFIVFRVQFYK